MRPFEFGTAALAVLLLSAFNADGQTIVGRISDARDGRAIAAAQVSLSGLESGAIEREPEPLSLDARVETGTVAGSSVRALGHLVERVDVPELLSEAAVSTVEDVLTGRIPGVMMIGTPNSAGDGAQIRIRGSASLGLIGDPIFFIDGIRMIGDRSYVQRYSAASRLNDIDLRDIESIEAIKGPAAAALYGTEASNGVIQIFTKRGEVGGPVFDATVETGTMWLPTRFITEGWVPDPVLCPSVPCSSADQLINTNLAEINKERGFGDVFTHGLTQRYNLSVRGGTELLRYSVSLSRNDQDGVVDWNWDERSSARASIQVHATKKLSFAWNGAYSKSERGPPQTFWASNFAWGGTLNTIFDDHPNRGFRTPPAAFDPSVHSQILAAKRSTWSLEVNHEVTNWLSYRLVTGVEEIHERFDGSDISFTLDEREDRTVVGKRDLPITTLDFSGTASFRFNGGSLGSASSYGIQYYHIEDLSSRSTRESLTANPRSPAGRALTTADRLLFQNTILGGYVQEEFDWENRVFLTTALRRDDNSAFRPQFDNAFYPRVMISWVLHEEGFWDIEQVSQLRLRGAWGASGQQPDAFASSRLTTAGTADNSDLVLTPSSFGNPGLGPERSAEIEVGFDTDLWDGRVSANFTWFNRSTKDVILGRVPAPSSGDNEIRLENIGEVKAWGTETSLSVRALEGKPVRWDMSIARCSMRIVTCRLSTCTSPRCAARTIRGPKTIRACRESG